MATQTRTTKYTISVLSYLMHHNHRTNQQIADYMRSDYPELSDTTVHRITKRLVEQRKITCAPASIDNIARYDSITTPHDHFHCKNCDKLKDIHIPRPFIDAIQSQLDSCLIEGSITVSGVCSKCLKSKKQIKSNTY